MSAATLLLRRLLEQAGGSADRGYLLVIDGEGLEDLPEHMPTPQASYSVHRATTELGLRHLLWKAQGAPLIAVIPESLAQRIQRSPDLLRRARNQRVHSLSVNDVLEVILGVRVVGAEDPYLQELALENIGLLTVALSNRTVPTVVDRRLLTQLLVDVSVGEQVRTLLPSQLLATWIQSPPHWPPNVCHLIRDTLPTLHGDEGRLLAWALEEPDNRLRSLVVHGCVITVDAQELPKRAWGPLWKAAEEKPLELDRAIVRRVLKRLAVDTVACLADLAGPILADADRLARECLTPDQVKTSQVLPLAFENRAFSLAQQAASGRPIGESDMKWLASHASASIHRAELRVLEALARVTRYLDHPGSLREDILGQIRDYLRGGAFADLAMHHLRRALSSSAHYHSEAAKVLEQARLRRDRENKKFADTLAGGYEQALHAEGAIPLHRVWKRVVAPVWQQDPKARLFVVVLDGCSYPIFLELLQGLSEDSAFPLGLRPDQDGIVTGMPGLALLPTVTSHSRGGIFLGEIPKDPLVAETVFRDQEEARTDKARFNQNSALGTRNRRLFLKGDLADGGQALLGALSDSGLDVVAAVFNAVDDQIGSANTGATVRLTPEDIGAFKPALRAAASAGRKILLLADHGHSPFVDKSLRAGAGKAPRYLALEKDEAAPEGFLEIDLASLAGPPQRRAFAWRTGAYLGMPQVGFHGGCSLEEMAVPIAWLEKDGLYANEPVWWYGQGVTTEPASDSKRPQELVSSKVPSREASVAPPKQLTLQLEPAERAERLGLPPGVLARLERDELTVLVILEENGTARTSELAGFLKKNPLRLNGLMRKLRRTLHSEGLSLFTDEVLPEGETLYRFDRNVS